MKLLSEVIVPRLNDQAMSKPVFSQYRKELLGQASQTVLEIGFGSGLNLAHYPADKVTKIVTIDPSPGRNKLAQKWVKASAIPVEQHFGSAEQLPFGDNQFDTIVSTWTLCSIPNLEQALAEIKRVLKPGGSFLFLEHGLNPDPHVQKWQGWLDNLHYHLPGGCHLNRDITTYIKSYLQIIALKQFAEPALGKLTGYLYFGKATKASGNHIDKQN
jgi:ubiquinone/menaquinone biosynthesis C-methylase UbiE